MKENNISQTGEPAGAPLQCPTEPRCRILVVDDDRAVCQLSTEVLIHSGYAVDSAADGAAAWEVLQIRAFNLLITDNNMPRLTGVELVRKLRSARIMLPVILASGSFAGETLAQNPPLQLAATLPKPFSPEELLGTVSSVLTATVSVPGQLEPLPDGRSQLGEEHGLEMTRLMMLPPQFPKRAPLSNVGRWRDKEPSPRLKFLPTR